MTKKRRKSEQEVLDHNIKDVLENGPGLRYGRQSTYTWRCKNNKHVVQTGLGCMGVGTMWVTIGKDEDVSDVPLVEHAVTCGCPVFNAYTYFCFLPTKTGGIKIDHVGIYKTGPDHPDPKVEYPTHLRKKKATWLRAGTAFGYTQEEAFRFAAEEQFKEQPAVQNGINQWLKHHGINQ